MCNIYNKIYYYFFIAIHGHQVPPLVRQRGGWSWLVTWPPGSPRRFRAYLRRLFRCCGSESTLECYVTGPQQYYANGLRSKWRVTAAANWQHCKCNSRAVSVSDRQWTVPELRKSREVNGGNKSAGSHAAKATVHNNHPIRVQQNTQRSFTLKSWPWQQ